MNKSRILSIITVVVFIIASLTLIQGCRKESKPTPKQQSAEADKKAPEALESLEKNIKDIFKQLDVKDEEAEEEKTEMKTETKTETKVKQDEEKAENESKQETKQEVKTETAEDKKWKAVKKKVEEMHKQWNTLQPEVATAGTPPEKIEDFSTTLNNVTVASDAKDLPNTLSQTNELYKYIPAFMEHFESKSPPTIKKLSYIVRDAKYNGANNQWEKAKASIVNLRTIWSMVKTQTKKEQEKDAAKVEVSIKELEKVVNESNANLTKLKSEIAIDNLEKLEESFEKGQKK